MENLFETASRLKLRFQYKGLLTTEDLWDLSLNELDSIFIGLNREAKASKDESLLDNKTNEDKILDIKIDIIKYIVKVKLEENKYRLEQQQTKEKLQNILNIIDNKKNAEIENLSVEELEAMAKELQSTINN